MRKTYRLCYRRLGNGPFQATFTEAGVEGKRIIKSSGRLNLLSTDGRSYAKMRGYLHFDEFSDSAAPVWWGTSTFAVDEVTDLQCTIEPDGIHATGVVYGERDGAPWFVPGGIRRFSTSPGYPNSRPKAAVVHATGLRNFMVFIDPDY
jgi:hypothetical protein